MQTLRLLVDADDLNAPDSRALIATAAAILREGGTVAFPTETVYGLGANALRADAVEKIFAAKQRPSWDPLIVHVVDAAMLGDVAAEISSNARLLIDAFWPGPLTLLLPRHGRVPDIVTAGRARVGVRMPGHPVAQALIRAAGVPVAAPSANTFGHTSPTSAQHVADDLEGRIDAILDAGAAQPAHGLESTVIDVGENPCVVYRPGVITLDDIRAAGVDAVAFQERAPDWSAPREALPSPGVGLRHYAPRARLVLVEEGPEQVRRFEDLAGEFAGERLGLMLPEGFAAEAVQNALVYRWGRWSDEEELARRLFAGLRELDADGATVILCPLPAARGVGIAIRDRLLKAARTE
jgi:L-threonylcarbamoyladenylate synthase